ncbi:conserved hypothetical protein [Candidatus Desulfarcum epimagneticum]|uniref:Aminoglycoside phosphotransferase n=1 Tax=uncultured Desulfobacteraceae bacterium TaxID=218296 RepID=A0A484HLP0_9BACT|nr:conserved hypothetical protein [uncultured Desulfobacteraceae bacterium]
MNALILAAGFGSRLLPYTRAIPKPLFPLGGRTVMDRIIEALEQAGCERIVINTHHLHDRIEAHLAKKTFRAAVSTLHEPVIEGTGGAIRNAAAFLGDGPFLAVNADIVTDLDFARLFDFHTAHSHPVTLALHDRPGFDPEFYRVETDEDRFIRRFDRPGQKGALAFSGVQALDPEIASFIPEKGFSHSIDIYEKMIEKGVGIKAFVARDMRWNDIGTPERYREEAFFHLAPEAFRRAGFPGAPNGLKTLPLAGDGSDRVWTRTIWGEKTIIAADHGIQPAMDPGKTREIDSFVRIGRHLRAKNTPVPEIYLHDPFSGLAFMEDLGDTRLESHVRAMTDPGEIASCYQKIIELLVRMSVEGADGFKPSLTWQTPAYDREVILEKECRYFLDAFLNPRLGKKTPFSFFENEFEALAENALKFAVNGFMHRDFQSRNIMVKDGRFYFIDFQGGRLGPIQYDLASLLIDPYVGLSPDIRDLLLTHCFDALSARRPVDRAAFFSGCHYCALARNLQMLGAFAHLSGVKGKTGFARHIPRALQTLKKSLDRFKDAEFPRLKAAVGEVAL